MKSMSRAAKFGASSILCSLAATAVGQVLPDAIQACKTEPDDARRLQCYDREVARFPMTAEQSFGLSGAHSTARQHQSSDAAAAVKNLTAKVVAIHDRPHAGFIVTLDNGQVWAQNDMDYTRRIDSGDTITIRSGALGSFWLVGPSGWTTKAHRLQ